MVMPFDRPLLAIEHQTKRQFTDRLAFYPFDPVVQIGHVADQLFAELPLRPKHAVSQHADKA
ncbi:hypothetical protein D3C74_300380 [compost metagenome]